MALAPGKTPPTFGYFCLSLIQYPTSFCQLVGAKFAELRRLGSSVAAGGGGGGVPAADFMPHFVITTGEAYLMASADKPGQ